MITINGQAWGNGMKASLLVGTIALSVLLSGCAAQAGSAPQSQASTGVAGQTPGAQEPTRVVVPPLETPKPEVSTAQPAVNYELKANLSEKELATNIVGVFSDWKSANANVEGRKNRDISLPLNQYAAETAAKNTVVYATKLFGADYASHRATDPALNRLITTLEEGNAANIKAFIQTDNSATTNVPDQNSNNIEPWKQTLNFEEVTSYTVLNGYHQLIINCVETDNRAMNIYGGTPAGNQKQKLTVTYLKEAEAVKLTAANFTFR